MSNISQGKGRPLSKEVETKVFSATLTLIETEGLSAVSRSSIATLAGVSRQTLYNRWATVGDIALDALLARADSEVSGDSAWDTPDGTEHLHKYLSRLASSVNTWARPGLKAVARLSLEDEEFAERFRDRLVEPRREALRAAIAQAANGGGANVDRACERVSSSLWYRLLVSDEELDETWINEMCQEEL